MAIDIAANRKRLDGIQANARELDRELKGPGGQALSRRKLLRYLIASIQAQLDLATGARAALDALEQARGGAVERARPVVTHSAPGRA